MKDVVGTKIRVGDKVAVLRPAGIAIGVVTDLAQTSVAVDMDCEFDRNLNKRTLFWDELVPAKFILVLKK